MRSNDPQALHKLIRQASEVRGAWSLDRTPHDAP
jgi:hypothetical protein